MPPKPDRGAERPYSGPAGLVVLADELEPLCVLLNDNPHPWNERMRVELRLLLARRLEEGRQ